MSRAHATQSRGRPRRSASPLVGGVTPHGAEIFQFNADYIRSLTDEQKLALLAGLSLEAREELKYWWEFWARPEQRPPDGPWFIWLVLAGRGFGKTRTGAEEVRRRVGLGYRRIALVAATADDARDVMIEGESGLLNVCPPWDEPKYEPSKRRLTWPNGAIATAYSAIEREQLRGKQHDFAWLDELCAWMYLDAYHHAKFSLRLGVTTGLPPQMMITTTPKPIPVLKKLLTRDDVKFTRGSTLANRANLRPEYLHEILTEYQGTRMGRQEIDAAVLMDMPGALWSETVLESSRRLAVGTGFGGLPKLPDHIEMFRVVIGVDPAGRIEDMTRVANGLPTIAGKLGDECGIVAAGKGDDQHGYLLADLSCQGTPAVWGQAVVDAYERLGADCVAVEKNHGGEAAQQVIEAEARRRGLGHIHVKLVWASKGKYTRAEPISALYEKNQIHHVGTADEFATLEDEMTTWVPGKPSPNRMDAAVFALTELMQGSGRVGGAVAGGRKPGNRPLLETGGLDPIWRTIYGT